MAGGVCPIHHLLLAKGPSCPTCRRIGDTTAASWGYSRFHAREQRCHTWLEEGGVVDGEVMACVVCVMERPRGQQSKPICLCSANASLLHLPLASLNSSFVVRKVLRDKANT